jgi:hypothetical protein
MSNKVTKNNPVRTHHAGPRVGRTDTAPPCFRSPHAQPPDLPYNGFYEHARCIVLVNRTWTTN